MNDLNIDYINDILSNSIISHKNLIGETLFVDTNPAKVESTQVRKVDSKIVTTKTTNEYKLDSLSIQIKDIDAFFIIKSISSIIDNQFIKSLENFGCDELKFYKKGLLKFFINPNPQVIIEEVGEYCDWIITTSDIFRHLSKHKDFVTLSDDKVTSIKLKGSINNLNIFLTDIIDGDFIWKGNSNDCSSVMLSELIISKESDVYDIKVDYLFNIRGVRKLILV